MASSEVIVKITEVKEVRESLEKAAWIAEEFNFVRDFLRLADDTDCYDAIFWRCTGVFAPLTFFVNCNDLFEWATADTEKVTSDDLPALKQAIADVGKSDEGNDWGFLLWVARKRGMRPQQPAYPKGERIRALFDACGPAREQEKL